MSERSDTFVPAVQNWLVRTTLQDTRRARALRALGDLIGAGRRGVHAKLRSGEHARGLLNHLFTRIYFEDEPANAIDPILGFVPVGRRDTLIARADATAASTSLTRSYRFDIVLQGEGETAFFDFLVRRP